MPDNMGMNGFPMNNQGMNNNNMGINGFPMSNQGNGMPLPNQNPGMNGFGSQNMMGMNMNGGVPYFGNGQQQQQGYGQWGGGQ